MAAEPDFNLEEFLETGLDGSITIVARDLPVILRRYQRSLATKLDADRRAKVAEKRFCSEFQTYIRNEAKEGGTKLTDDATKALVLADPECQKMQDRALQTEFEAELRRADVDALRAKLALLPALIGHINRTEPVQ